jgi:polyprenyl-phospho-N-acetylgalactosaminyl synthase
MSTWIVIAAYNEEKKIASVVKNLINKGFSNIVVVDDCSKDNTYSIIGNLPVRALHHVINRGQGAALRTGIAYALSQNADFIVTFDADGQHRAEDVIGMIKLLKEKKCDIVLGSRFLKKETALLVPLKKRILLKGAVFITWVLSGIRLTDAHNGLRVMTARAAKKIEINFDGFEHASEIVDEIARKKISYREFPTSIDYTEYSKAKGQSMWNSLRIVFKMFLRWK